MKHKYTLLLIACLIVLLFAPFVGKHLLNMGEIWRGEGADAEIFWRVRLVRVVMSFAAGGGLAICGMIFQSMFQNPLATPYTLGVASGASLGASLFFAFNPWGLFLGFGGVLFAFVGALGTVFLVYAAARLAGGTNQALLLAGVAVNFSFSAVIMFIQYTADFAGTQRIIRFLVGSVDAASHVSVMFTVPVVLVGFALATLYRRELDLTSISEEVARSRGADTFKMKIALYLATSVMLGTIISFCGPIGFVGMMSPHICRRVVGGGHYTLCPVTFMFGGAFLTLCDTAARTVIFPAEIPVGVITAMLGGPFFILLLIRNRA